MHCTLLITVRVQKNHVYNLSYNSFWLNYLWKFCFKNRFFTDRSTYRYFRTFSLTRESDTWSTLYIFSTSIQLLVFVLFIRYNKLTEILNFIIFSNLEFSEKVFVQGELPSESTINRLFLGPSPTRWHYEPGYLMMPISNGICQYVWKNAVLNKNICHCWDRHRARFPEKNSNAQEHIQMIQRCALDFLPENTLGDGPALRIFSRIYG